MKNQKLKRLFKALQTPVQPVPNDAGFTLVELIVVIALLGLLATIAGGQIFSQFTKGKINTTKIQMRQLGTVLDQFRAECGFYPSSEQGLDALLQKPSIGRECKNYQTEGYLKDKKLPKDGFGNDFGYQSDGNTYVITSFGADGKEGGTEADADINSDKMD
jgi:general secretion pathway protein G